MRFENLTPDRIKTRDTLVARHVQAPPFTGIIVKKLASILLLLVTAMSAVGCSVLASERFYRDHPLTDIYFHEYNDD